MLERFVDWLNVNKVVLANVLVIVIDFSNYNFWEGIVILQSPKLLLLFLTE